MINSTPLRGEFVELVPLQDLAVLKQIVEPWLADSAFFEIACGLGEAVSLADFVNFVVEARTITLWQLQPLQSARVIPETLAIVSQATQLHRVAVYTAAGQHPLPIAWWDDVIATLSEFLMLTFPELLRVFVHLPLPIVQEQQDALLYQGFQEWGTSFLLREPQRAVFGLDREVFDHYRRALAFDFE